MNHILLPPLNVFYEKMKEKQNQKPNTEERIFRTSQGERTEWEYYRPLRILWQLLSPKKSALTKFLKMTHFKLTFKEPDTTRRVQTGIHQEKAEKNKHNIILLLLLKDSRRDRKAPRQKEKHICLWLLHPAHLSLNSAGNTHCVVL